MTHEDEIEYLIVKLFDNDEQYEQWLNTPLVYLDYKKPIECNTWKRLLELRRVEEFFSP